MELRQLRYFVQVAELLNVTQAAQRLYMSQNTLSQQIKQLEAELGTPLFDRIGKRITLTEAGQHFRIYAQQTLASAASGVQALRDLANGEAGTLAVGATYALRARLTQALIHFAPRYTDVHLEVLFGTTDKLLERLHAGQLDLVLTFGEQGLGGQLAQQLLFESRMALVVSSSSALAERTSIALAELRSLRLALPVQGYSTRQLLDKAFAARQIEPTLTLEINDIPTLLTLVKTGYWHTILTMANIEGETGVQAIPVTEEELNRQAWIVWLKNTHRKKAAIRFCELLVNTNQ